MKLFAHPKCLTEAIAPVITLNNLMGLRVFKYRGQPRPILSLIYLLFLYCLYCNGSLYWTEEYYMDIKLLKLEYFLYTMLNNIIIYLTLVKLLLGWWYSKKFNDCYKHIFEIDETLRQLGSTVNYDRIYFITIGVMTTWFTFNFCTCIVVFIVMRLHSNLYTTIGTLVVYSYGLAVNSISIFDFYIFVKYLQMRFDLINQLLHEHSMLSTKKIKLGFLKCKIILKSWMMSNDIQSRFSNQDSPSHFQKQFQGKFQNRSQQQNSVLTECQKRKYLLQIIKQVHLQLCKVAKTVCFILGVQTAFEIAVIIMFLTGSLYNIYIRYIAPQYKITDSLLQQTAVTIIVNSFHLLKIIFLSRVCKHAADKGNKTIEIIYSIYGCDTESGVQEEIQQFGIQILQNPVKFSAYGISLDNHVLTMMLKAVTTYLVIMIQVSNSLESNKTIQNA